MATLRGPHGCPWDREQTHTTLRPFLLEETYEALEAIDRQDFADLRGELGDVLFQCVFQSQLAAEARRFDIVDVVEAITTKLIGRHPHVFAPDGRPLSPGRRSRSVRSSTAVIEQWEKLKAREQARAGAPRRVLSGIPRTLPSLARAQEIGTRVAAVGFDWARSTDVMDKIDEEVRELRDALATDPAHTAEEFGDFLFSVASLARHLKLDPESALREANDKFSRRFQDLEDEFTRRGRTVHDATPAELEEAWTRVKVKNLASRGRKRRVSSASAKR